MKQPSTGQINLWKKKYGELHQIFPDQSNEEIFCIVRHPNIEDIILSSVVGGLDDFKIGASQLESCWIDGDKEILDDVELHKAAAERMGKIFKTYPTTVEYVKLTPEILKEIPEEHKERVKADKELRRMTMIIMPEFIDDKGHVEVAALDLKALCFKPQLKDIEAADLATNTADRGLVFLQECWISGDEELKSGSEEIKFSAYLAANLILRRYAAKVVKL